MKKKLLGILVLLASISLGFAQRIVINEINYHPSSENIQEQWFELYNSGADAIDLSGCSITKGVSFTFPAGTRIGGDGYLVVAADKEVFMRLYPSVYSVVGNWSGKLSQRGENIRLSDASGNVLAEVEYFPDGDWGKRQLELDATCNKYGWVWFAEHDGAGKSLELVNPYAPVAVGENWESSSVVGGTPGAVNSQYRVGSAQAPLIWNVTHAPALPAPSEMVTISAHVCSDRAEVPEVKAHWRVGKESVFQELELVDDGNLRVSGDAVAGDGVYSGKIAGQSSGEIVSFYVTAARLDAPENMRTYPQVQLADGRAPWLNYQIMDQTYNGDQPILYIILDPLERAYLESIWGADTICETMVSGTLIYQAPGQAMPEVCYQSGFRNRGKGTAALVPHNIHITTPKDKPFEGRSSLNTNTKDTYCQIISSVISRLAGVPMAESRPVQVRVNGENLAKPIAPQFGSYAGNEPINGDFVTRQFPLDEGGNLYRGKRYMYSWDLGVADLTWRGTNWGSYTNAYTKENNSMENDWSDLIELLDVLNNASDEQFVGEVERLVNVDEWMRYFAVNTLLANQETSLSTGVGDDYALYRGELDKRFSVITYDMDAVMGLGERTEIYGQGLWMMNELRAVARMMTNNNFVPIYFKHLREMGTGLFAPAQMDILLDNVLGSWVSPTSLANMKQFNAAHVKYILSLIPSTFSITSSFAKVNGYSCVNESQIVLSGTADAERTSRITINGVPANYVAWQGNWDASLNLFPGLNLLIIKAYDLEGREIEYREEYLLYNVEIQSTLSATNLTENLTLQADKGPWLISTNLTIGNGATLTIEPGTSVYLGSDVGLIIGMGGRMVAEGTEKAPIVLSAVPGKANWKNIVLNHPGVTYAEGDPENRIRYVHIRDNGDIAINANYGTFYLDHLTFGTMSYQYLNLNWCSFMISYCRFPSSNANIQLVRSAGGTLMNGRGVFYRNYFGKIDGHNDPADVTDGSWSLSSKFQMIENVFMGSGDDLLDLDGTDAWIEGNILMHSHQHNSYGGASAISGGRDENRTAENYIVGNLFYDNDHAVKAKDGNFHVMVHNTIVRITNEGGDDTDCGMLGCVDYGYPEAKGYYVRDNIFYKVDKLLRGHTNAVITLSGNIMEEQWDTTLGWARGEKNSLSNPRFLYIPTVEETTNFQTWDQAQIMKEWFATYPDSPAVGTGLNGKDKGFTVQRGVSISGEPTDPISTQLVTLTVGSCYSDFGSTVEDLPNGAGYVAYRYRLNKDGVFGGWSEECSIDTPLQLSSMTEGTYFVEVSGKKHVGMWDDDERMGEAAFVAQSKSWKVVADAEPIRLPSNVVLNEVDFEKGSIEIYNQGLESVDLSDWCITDDTQLVGKIVFANAMLEPGAFLCVPTGSMLVLNSEGSSLYLMQGNQVMDALTYGPQVNGYSLGRMNACGWMLCKSTLGGINESIAVGDPSVLKINEWLSSEQSVADSDFIELYNPSAYPVALGGLYLSDATGSLKQFAIAPNTFMSGGGYLVFWADGKPMLGVSHLNFKLSASVGSICLSDEKSNILDIVIYQSQRLDISEGRSPDGSQAIQSFTVPTPGTKNLMTTFTTLIETERMNLIAMTNTWKYNQSGLNLGTEWRNPSYDDSTWPSGNALFYNEYDPLPAEKNTPLTLGPRTFYFRTTLDVSEEDFSRWSQSASGWSFQMNTILDDGVVLYLNGKEFSRVNMYDTEVNYLTWAISNEGRLQGPFNIPLTNLVVGENLIAAELHQDKMNSSDAVMGVEIYAECSTTNRVSMLKQIRFSELFAMGETVVGEGENNVDWVELFNPTEESLNLSGMSLTKDSTQPRAWVFPEGTVMEAGSYLVVNCSNTETGVDTNDLTATLDLSITGDSLYLYSSEYDGGNLVDSVRYGFQVPGLSLSRLNVTKDEWVLSGPTPGSVNGSCELSDSANVKINEWMASPKSGGDWFELYNEGSAPVSLGGFYLTDDLADLTQFRIPANSYLGTGAHAWIKIMADEELEKGAHHVNFKLSGSGDLVALLNSQGGFVDIVSFGKQTKGISEGRYPDGSDFIYTFEQATPGSRNIYGEIPDDLDTDGDGMPDKWEIQYGLNPSDPLDAALDADGDHQTNLNEFIAGTNPLDAKDCLCIRNVALQTENGELWIAMVVPVVEGHSYSLESRGNNEREWIVVENIPTVIKTENLEWKFKLENSTGQYYRIVTPER